MQLYIFDMGGVVSENTRVAPYIAEYLGISLDSFNELALKAQIRQVESGELSAEDFWCLFSQASGLKIEEDLWKRFFKPVLNPDTVAIIEALKQNKRVVLGTNTIESHYAVHAERGDYDFFHAIYASNKIGFVKPDPQFYLHILRIEGYRPEETVFIDDSLANIKAATEVGICGIHFVGAEDLSRELGIALRQKS